MITYILTFIFGFTCGGIILVLWVLLVLYRFLNHLQDKSHEYNNRKDRVKMDDSDIQSRELCCYVKLQSWSESTNGPNKLVPWTYAVLRGNSLFIFEDKSKDNLLQVISLDETEVSVPNRNWTSPFNAIEIYNPIEPLLENTYKVYLYFAVGKDLEEWFWSVKIASQLSENVHTIVEQERKILNNFTELKNRIYENSEELAPEAWVNALLPRFWWNLFDNKSFRKFIVKRLGKRIAKITDFPKFIQSMVLHTIDIGPALPFVSNAKLHNISNDGAVDIDIDLDYNGVFSMTIKIKTSMSLPGTSLELPATAMIDVKRLTGRLRIHVSPPPCERFWIAFHTLPDIDIQADTQIALLDSQQGTGINIPRLAGNIIKKLKGDLTKVIVNKLKADIVGEKMVLPNMEDFPIPYFTHHQGEEEEDYMSQVILSREPASEDEKKRKGTGVLDISPSGVTILNKRIESDQIVPLIKSYASKGGVKKLTTSGVRTLQNNRPSQKVIKENMEKGRQALIDSGMTNPKNWKDPLYSNLESVKDSVVGSIDGLYQYGVKKPKKDMPPDFINPTIKNPSLSEKKLLTIRKKNEKNVKDGSSSPRRNRRDNNKE